MNEVRQGKEPRPSPQERVAPRFARVVDLGGAVHTLNELVRLRDSGMVLVVASFGRYSPWFRGSSGTFVPLVSGPRLPRVWDSLVPLCSSYHQEPSLVGPIPRRAYPRDFG